jgi:hypothetical protein
MIVYCLFEEVLHEETYLKAVCLSEAKAQDLMNTLESKNKDKNTSYYFDKWYTDVISGVR